jgi:osmotically-inducible protein OsmY
VRGGAAVVIAGPSTPGSRLAHDAAGEHTMRQVWAASGLIFMASVAGAAEGRNPAVIEAEARRVIRDLTVDQPDTLFNFVEVAVDGDVVTLSGTVRHQSRGAQIEREVARITGVGAVRNRLHSPRLGASDERLRRELVRSIYGSPGLSRYALLLEPPVRILVERGRVVLAGRVAARVEREMLTHIARRTEAFEVENEVVVDAEVANEPVGQVGVGFR